MENLAFCFDMDHFCKIFQEPQGNPNPLAKAELNLLAHLVGGSSKKPESELYVSDNSLWMNMESKS